MNIAKWKILAVSMTLICSSVLPVLAYLYFYRTPNYTLNSGVILQGGSALGFYWDMACTQPVTFIDFGQIVVPETIPAILAVRDVYIRNEGTDDLNIYWNSTLVSLTSSLRDNWLVFWEPSNYYSLNGTSIQPNAMIPARYELAILGPATTGTYNWTVTFWGEH